MYIEKHGISFIKHKHFYLIMLFLFLSSSYLFAQESKKYTFYDTLSYRLYTQSKWDSVIIIGNEALSNNIDYYYLRMRLGIANFSIKNYSFASQHFEKATEMNCNNTVLEYLYNSYINERKFRSAFYLTKNMSDDLIKKLNLLQPHFLSNVNLEYAQAFVDNWNDVKAKNTTPTKPNNYRLEKDITGPFISYTVNLHHELSQKWSWFNSFSYFDVLSYQQLYFDNSIQHQSDYHLYEGHYYTSFTNWHNTVSPFTFYIHLSTLIANKYEYNLIHPVIAAPPLPPVTTYIYNIHPLNYSIFNFLAGIQKNYYHEKTNTQLNAGFAKVINDNIAFAGVSFDYFLVKNYLSAKSTASGSSDFTNKSVNGYLQQSIILQLFKKINIETSYIYGKIQNMPNLDGTIIYNTPYQINDKWINVLTYSFNQHFSIYLSYIFQHCTYENNFYGFEKMNNQNKPVFSLSTIKYNFNNKIILGGLLWNI